MLDRSERGMLLVSGPDAAEYLQGQLTNDIEALEPGHGLLRGAARPQGPHAGRHAGPAPRDGRPLARHRARGARSGRCATCGCTRSAARSRSRTRPSDWTIALADRARRASEVAGVGAARREHAQRETRRRTASSPRRRHRPRRRPDRPRRATPASCTTPAGRRGRRRGQRGGGRDPPGRVRPPALRPRDDDGARCPPEAGIVERAVDFTKGCYIGQETVARLHYKGKPNRHLRGLRLEAPAERRRRDPPRRSRGRRGRDGRALPRPRPDRARDRPAGGRAGGARRGRRRAVGAEVVELPF